MSDPPPFDGGLGFGGEAESPQEFREGQGEVNRDLVTPPPQYHPDQQVGFSYAVL